MEKVNPGSILRTETILSVSGNVQQPRQFTASELEQLPRKTLAVHDQQGQPTTYEGVLLTDLFQQLGVPQGKKLQGENMALCLVIEATDGHQIVYGLPEFDPAFGNRIALLADRRDGKPLDSSEAPLRLILPEDRRHSRWIRKITCMKVLRVNSI